MEVLLPSTVEELNLLQTPLDLPSPTILLKSSNRGFENIFVEKRFKREVSLPNGVENWDIENIDSYLHFEDDPEDQKVTQRNNDRLVPEEGDIRPRCGSFSSVSSSMDDKSFLFPNYGMKAFNTVCVDSGSTCISADHSYVSNASPVFKNFEPEETYQNLDMYLQQVPEMPMTENLPSPLSNSSDSNFDLASLHSFSLSSPAPDNFLSERSVKRPLDTSSEDEIFGLKKPRFQEDSYSSTRQKNCASSKSTRKTRKEKQKEMEVRVVDLEKEKEDLKVQVRLLEEMIQAHKMQLYAILQKR